MPSRPRRYICENKAQAQGALRALRDRFSSHSDQPSHRYSTYYDTFDWRVYREASTIFTTRGEAKTLLQWTDRWGSLRYQIALKTEPGFAWDLPQGPLRDELEELIAMRRLLPTAIVAADAETHRILDSREKTVARVCCEAVQARDPWHHSRVVELGSVIEALPVRGYEGEFHDLIGFLEADLALVQSLESELELALQGLGRQLGGYSSKLIVELDPGMPALDAAKSIFSRLFEVIEQNEAGVKLDLDSEFLHDFRVAVRRTRSGLTQIKGVFPPATVEKFRREFSWLGQITGPTRDLHVYRLKMPSYRASLPSHVRADLDPLQDFLDRHQKLEHGDLVQLLESDRYRRLLDDWREFLQAKLEITADMAAARRPIIDLSSRRIWKSYRRVMKRGRAIQPDSPAEMLHRMRIDCKKLRYLLEFFGTLYPESDITPLIRALKLLQDNLGDFNDLEIQQKTLKEFGHTMQAEGIGSVRAVMAMGRLVASLEEKQQTERVRFHRRFEAFSRRKNRRRFRRLFKLQEADPE